MTRFLALFLSLSIVLQPVVALAQEITQEQDRTIDSVLTVETIAAEQERLRR